MNSNSILFKNFFLNFGMVSEKIWNFQFFVRFFFNFQKNRSQKLSMLEKNQDSFEICIEFRTK